MALTSVKPVLLFMTEASLNVLDYPAASRTDGS